MQTLQSLRSFRDLRAVSPGLCPRRQRFPPMLRSTLGREALSTLSNSPNPTRAVGLRPDQTSRKYNPRTLTGRYVLAGISDRVLVNARPRGPVSKRVCRAMLVRQTGTCGSGICPLSPRRTAMMPLHFALPVHPWDIRQCSLNAAAPDLPCRGDPALATGCAAAAAQPCVCEG